MTKEANKSHRRSVRMKGYDYSHAGAYFMTIVTYRRDCLFGKIVNGVMKLNDLGKIAREEWFRTGSIRNYLELIPDEFVIMPNHIHGIITIHEDHRRGTIYRAPTEEKFGYPVVGSIPTILRTFKASVSRRARIELGMVNIW